MQSINEETLLMFGVWYLFFLFSTVCHEAAHAWAGKKLGDITAEDWLTLNPIPHLQRTPFGLILLPIITYAMYAKNGWRVQDGAWMMGFASVPCDPYWARRNPKKFGWMSMAGPAANLSLMLLFLTILFTVSTLITNGTIPKTEANIRLLDILYIPAYINLIYAAFNLMPLPPLDGSRIPNILLSKQDSQKYLDFITNGSYSLFGILIAWYTFMHVFEYVWIPIYNVILGLFKSFFSLFI